MAKFYTCKNDRAFKEVFLKPDNSDLLKALLEFILKIKIDKLEINSQNKDYLHARSTAYICNIYQSNASVGDTYNEDTDIIQVNLTWGLGRNNDEMKIYKIMNEKGELYVKNFIIYEINMDYYDKIWYSKNEEEDKRKIQNSLLSEAKEEGISQGYTSGINDGISKGENKKSIEIAKNMLKKNISIEDISDITGLSIEEINKLTK